MQQMKYYSIFIYYLIAIIIAIVLYIVWYIKVYQNLDLEKVSSYECGFNPLEDAFDVQIYMVVLLFIIFDFLLSWLGSWLGAKLDNKFFTNSCKSFITTIFIFSLDRKFFTTSCKIVGIFWWIKAEVMGFFSFFLIKLDRKFLIMKEFTLFSWIKAEVMGFFSFFLIKLNSCKSFITTIFIFSLDRKFFTTSCKIVGIFWWIKAEVMGFFSFFLIKLDRKFLIMKEFTLFSWIKAQVMGFFLIKLFSLVIKSIFCKITVICKEFINGLKRLIHLFLKFVGSNVKKYGGVGTMIGGSENKDKSDQLNKVEHFNNLTDQWTVYGYDYRLPLIVIGTVIGIGGICYGCYRVYKNYKKGDNDDGSVSSISKLRRQKPKKEKSSTAEINKAEIVSTTAEINKAEIVSTTAQGVDEKVDVVNTTGEEVKVDDKVEVVNTTGEEVKVDDKVEVVNTTGEEVKVDDKVEVSPEVNTTVEEVKVDDKVDVSPEVESASSEKFPFEENTTSAPSTTSMEVVELDEESRKLLSKMVRPKVKQSSAVNSEVIEEQIKKIKKYELKEPVSLSYSKVTKSYSKDVEHIYKQVVRLEAEHSLFPCDVGTEISVLWQKDDVIIGECTILKNVVIKKGNVTKELKDGININFVITYKENLQGKIGKIYIVLDSKLKEILWFIDGHIKTGYENSITKFINHEVDEGNKALKENLKKDLGLGQLKDEKMINELLVLSKPVICNTYKDFWLTEKVEEEEIQKRFSLTINQIIETNYTTYMKDRFPLQDVNKINMKFIEFGEVISKGVKWSDYKKVVQESLKNVEGTYNFKQSMERSGYLMWEQREYLNRVWQVQYKMYDEGEIIFLNTLMGTASLGFITEEAYDGMKTKKNMEIIPYIIKKKDKTGRTGNTGIVQELGIEVIDTTSYEEDLVMLMVNNMDQILAPLFFIMNCDECLRFWIIYMIQIFLAFYMQIRNDYVHLYGQEGREIWETMGFWKLFYFEYQDNVNIPEEVLKKGVIKIIWFDIKRNIKCKVNEEWNELKRNVKVLKRNVQEEWTDLKNLKIKVKEIWIKKNKIK